jgi:hypothetical protein
MTNYEDEEADNHEVEGNEPADQGGAPAPSGNRNFLLALGILGGIFVLLLIVLAVWLLSRPRAGTTANIDATNQVIMTANAETASAATLSAALLLTPSATATPTNTRVPPTATHTQVVVQPTASQTLQSSQGGGGAATLTPNLQTRTATIVALLTQSMGQTQTQAVKGNLTGTATALPKTGFAEDVGLPWLFGLAAGLVLIIVLVRRLRLAPGR